MHCIVQKWRFRMVAPESMFVLSWKARWSYRPQAPSSVLPIYWRKRGA